MQSTAGPDAVGGLHTGARALEYVKTPSRGHGEYAAEGSQRKLVEEARICGSNPNRVKALAESLVDRKWRPGAFEGSRCVSTRNQHHDA